jgi:hypothetical protein
MLNLKPDGNGHIMFEEQSVSYWVQLFDYSDKDVDDQILWGLCWRGEQLGGSFFFHTWLI